MKTFRKRQKARLNSKKRVDLGRRGRKGGKKKMWTTKKKGKKKTKRQIIHKQLVKK